MASTTSMDYGRLFAQAHELQHPQLLARKVTLLDELLDHSDLSESLKSELTSLKEICLSMMNTVVNYDPSKMADFVATNRVIAEFSPKSDHVPSAKRSVREITTSDTSQAKRLCERSSISEPLDSGFEILSDTSPQMPCRVSCESVLSNVEDEVMKIISRMTPSIMINNIAMSRILCLKYLLGEETCHFVECTSLQYKVFSNTTLDIKIHLKTLYGERVDHTLPTPKSLKKWWTRFILNAPFKVQHYVFRQGRSELHIEFHPMLKKLLEDPKDRRERVRKFLSDALVTFLGEGYYATLENFGIFGISMRSIKSAVLDDLLPK